MIHDRRLTIASIASSAPMGAESYQENVTRRAAYAMRVESPNDAWTIRRFVVRSMRSRLAGNRRLPLGWLATASPDARRRVGRLLFAGDSVSHRMNLELPPSPHADVATLHDVIAWRFPDESPPVAAAVEELRRAAAVICVSEFTANEAVELLGIRDPFVIPNGVDERFVDAAPLSAVSRSELGVPDRYVLHSGGASQRKNLEALAAAWPRVRRERPDLTLVLTGPSHARRTALFAGLDGIRLTGRVSDRAMPAIVAGATVVVIPSLYEGFGLPALEAMAAGVPVVAAATSSLPEVVGDAGLLVAPTAAGIAEGILHASSSDAAIGRLVQSGRERAKAYTWERSALAHAQVWGSIR